MRSTVLASLLALAAPSFAATCANPDTRPTVVIGTTDTLVPNRDADGAGSGTCTINDLLAASLPNTTWSSRAQFVSNANRVIAGLPADVVSAAQRRALLEAVATSDIGSTLTVKLIGFNDFHGNINPVSGNYFGVTGPTGGVAYMASAVAALKAQNPNNVVVSAGDLIGASPLASALFHDEPAVEAMNRLGLEFNAVGNHEFDEGRDELVRMQNGGCHPDAAEQANGHTCRGAEVGTPVPFEGAKFKFLAANVVDRATGKTLFPAYKVKTFRGIPVAFIGMTLKGTPNIVTPSGVASLEFRDEAETVNRLIPQLKNQGIRAIAVIVHEGGFTTGGKDDCNGASGAILDIVKRLDPEVDVVVSGHTHWAYNCVYDGRRLTSSGAFSRMLTDIDLTIDTASRNIVATSATNRVVTNAGATPTPEVKAIIDRYNALSAPLANAKVGYITADMTKAQNSAGESIAGNLVADAQLDATRPAAKGGAVAAFMNPGGLRGTDPVLGFTSSAAGEGDGVITYGEAFTFQPFGNSLVVMTLTGAQIKQMLEQQFVPSATASAACKAYNPQTTQRILQPSASVAYSWSPARPDCDKVDATTLKINGVTVDPSASYRITVNSFLATGGDGFAVLSSGTERVGGDVDLDALVNYFGKVSSPSTPLAPPALGRITRY
ncbi:bifunctional metallophosphatase/5'-nucleotidase [Niveibacterium microcysteis]|uniref:Bifunctional metallophosphatase/5'-nucleotidase n=2 Tax=Niveibacterium microcysteis TaxID=2811415 RepID=A0ABX7MBR3_9RHOO|nr:bifunctional metallophosphatase/5'-nucleotidase [Niveibacterium microcysteis]